MYKRQGADTECDLTIEARNPAERESIARLRNRLLAEHCGAALADVEAALKAKGSLLAVAGELSANGHSLRPIEDGEPDPEEVTAYMEALADLRRPFSFGSLMQALRRRFAARSSPILIAAVIAVFAALIAAWNFSPLSNYANAQSVQAAFNDIAANGFAPLLVIAVFLAGGLVAFPLLVLIAATAAAFGPWLGFLYALTGSIASALLTFGIGAILGRDVLKKWMGPRLNRLRQKIVRQGVLAIALVRMVPVAPFTLVNIVAGASGIRLLDFIGGTVLGLLPGLILMSALGAQIARLVTAPSAFELMLLALCILAWIGLSFGVQAALRRFGDGTS